MTAYCDRVLALGAVSADCLPKQTRFASSCLQGAPAGDPQTCSSEALGTQAPSGPRQPAPPLQPQPLQRHASSAKAGDMANSENRTRTIGMARMGDTPSLTHTSVNVHVLFFLGKRVERLFYNLTS